MLSGNCTETLSIQVSVTIPCSRAKLITNGIAPLPFPLPALLKQFRYIKRGEGQGEGTFSILCNVRVERRICSRDRLFQRNHLVVQICAPEVVREIHGDGE